MAPVLGSSRNGTPPGRDKCEKHKCGIGSAGAPKDTHLELAVGVDQLLSLGAPTCSRLLKVWNLQLTQHLPDQLRDGGGRGRGSIKKNPQPSWCLPPARPVDSPYLDEWRGLVHPHAERLLRKAGGARAVAMASPAFQDRAKAGKQGTISVIAVAMASPALKMMLHDYICQPVLIDIISGRAGFFVLKKEPAFALLSDLDC